MTIPTWCEGKGLCIDVVVTCPFSSSNINRDSPCEYIAAHLKHRKYDADFVGTNYDFSALSFESTGAVNREGKEVLKQLFRFAARNSSTNLSVYAGRAWARLSCTLQSAVAQSIINRVPEPDSSAGALNLDDDEEIPVPRVSVLAQTSPRASLLRPSAPMFVPSCDLGPILAGPGPVSPYIEVSSPTRAAVSSPVRSVVLYNVTPAAFLFMLNLFPEPILARGWLQPDLWSCFCQ